MKDVVKEQSVGILVLIDGLPPPHLEAGPETKFGLNFLRWSTLLLEVLILQFYYINIDWFKYPSSSFEIYLGICS